MSFLVSKASVETFNFLSMTSFSPPLNCTADDLSASAILFLESFRWPSFWSVSQFPISRTIPRGPARASRPRQALDLGLNLKCLSFARHESVSRRLFLKFKSPGNFGPEKPLLVNRLKLDVWREPLFCSVVIRFETLLRLFGFENFSGPSGNSPQGSMFFQSTSTSTFNFI